MRKKQFHSVQSGSDWSLTQWLEGLTEEEDEDGEKVHDILQFEFLPLIDRTGYRATVLCDHLVGD